MTSPRSYTLKRLCFGVIFILLLTETIIPSFAYLGLSTSSSGEGYDQSIIYLNGYFYAFYVSSVDSKIYYRSGINETNVNPERQAVNAVCGSTTTCFAVTFINNTNIVMVAYDSGNTVYTKNGTANNGLITWSSTSTVKVTAYAGCICSFVETDNYIWVVFEEDSAGKYYVSSARSQKNQMSWTYAAVSSLENPAGGNTGGIRAAKASWKTDDTLVYVFVPFNKAYFYYIIKNVSYTYKAGFIGNRTSGQAFFFPMKLASSYPSSGDNQVYFFWETSGTLGTPIRYSHINSSLLWTSQVVVQGANEGYFSVSSYRNSLSIYYSALASAIIWNQSMPYSTQTWAAQTVLDTANSGVDSVSSLVFPSSDNTIGVSTHGAGSNFGVVMQQSISPVFSGKLCGDIGERNNTEAKLSKLTSIMCIGNFNTGAIINRTGYTIHNYTNQFMSAWITLSIYTGDNAAVISNEHPLKIIWQKTYEVRNNTNNLQVNYYPNLFIPDHTLVAIAISATEDLSFNSTSNTNTQFTVNQYAPTSVSFLQSTDNKVGIYAYWNRVNVSFAGDNTFTVQTTEFISIPQNFQNFWISVGFPPNVGGIIMLIVGVIMLSIIVIVKGIDEPEKVIALLGVAAVLCASAANLIPVEYGIGVMVFVAGFFAVKIYSRIAGGS